MTTVSTFRLYLLRAGYLLIVVVLAPGIWPQIVYGVPSMELMHGTAICMFWAVSLLALLGIRYPLQMLPLLLYEIVWKATWLLAVALPRWHTHQMDAATKEWAFGCLTMLIFPIIVPWAYVFENYVKKAGDAWRRRTVCVAPVPD